MECNLNEYRSGSFGNDEIMNECQSTLSEKDIILKKLNESNEEIDLNCLYEEGLQQSTNKVEGCQLEVKCFLKENNLAFLRSKKNQFVKLKKNNKIHDNVIYEYLKGVNWIYQYYFQDNLLPFVQPVLLVKKKMKLLRQQ